MYQTVYIEINLICSFILVILLRKNNETGDRQATSLAYNDVLIATLVILLLDIAWACVEGRVTPLFIKLNYFFNAWYLFESCLIAFFWMRFVLFRLHGSPLYDRFKLLIALPLIVMLLLCALTPWTHWLFRITDANVYERGPLIFIQQIVCFGYLLAATGYALYRAQKSTDRDYRYDALTLCSFVVLPGLGGGAAILFYGLPLSWTLTTISLLMVYLNLQGHQISTDDLTKLNNRRQFDRYLLAQTEDQHRDDRLYMLLIDIDSFKKINDTYGHLEGDNALRLASDILKQVCSVWNCFLARYGGDEFAILLRAIDATRVARLKDDLNEAFARFNATHDKPYSLNISIGSGAYSHESGTSSSLIAQADHALYEAKLEKKNAEAQTPRA